LDIAGIIMKLLLVLLLIAMNGFFVAAEFCCVRIRPSRLETLISEGSRQAKYAKYLTDHLNDALSVTQLGITLASLGLGWIGEPAVAELILPVTRWFGLDDVIGHTLSLTIAFALITGGHIILGELTPKTLALQRYEGIMLSIALPLVIIERLTYPIVWLMNESANLVAKYLLGVNVDGETDADAHSEEEIRLLMEESRRQGLVDKTEADFVDNVFDFADLNTREIMVPRTDMVCIYLEDSMEETMKTIVEGRFTRYPICREDKDHIIGFLHVKDLLHHFHEYPHQRLNLRRLARKALVVPESMDVSVLLKTMQRSHSQLAIVVDEFGGTAGLVTIEDIVEEIVGDIQDEFDEERPTAEARGGLVYSVDAKMLLEELEDILELDIEDDDVDTVGGWLYDQIGGTPRVGMMASAHGATLFVEEVDGARITRVLIQLATPLTREHDEIV